MKNRNIAFTTTIIVALGCFAFLLTPNAFGVNPAPDGCYPNFTTAEGCDALNSLTTGAGNTALGWRSLFSNTDASFNTAVGGGALVLNNGGNNTAVGAAALLLNTTGSNNTAVGTDALVFNDSASANTAIGYFALADNTTGFRNTAIGEQALAENIDSQFNTATGSLALSNNTTGGSNTAVGVSALLNNVSGSFNQAFGRGALRFCTGSNNIAIGSEAGEAIMGTDDHIVIGLPGENGPSGRCYIGRIRGVTVANADGINVIIDSDGQLGTSNSSRRFKKDIKPMEHKTSEAILALKPVTFHYKNMDTKKAENTPQFGLIAEEVAEINPDLVVYDNDGQPLSVRYDAVNAMLLNEFLKAHKKVEEQQASITQLNSKVANQAAIIAQQQKGMEALTVQLKEQAAQIQKVSARIEMSKPAPRVAVNRD